MPLHAPSTLGVGTASRSRTLRACSTRSTTGTTPIFSAFDAPVAATFVWNEASERQLRDRIQKELKLEGPVRLSHLELAEEGETERNHVIIVRHGGPLSSVATHGEDGGKDWLYYRPSTEATLIYSPSRGIVEVCANSPSMRQDMAVAFAEVGLGEDLSNKPLSFKFYNLTRFRGSLTLPLHQPGGLLVERISVVEAEVCLGDRRRRLTLKVPAEDTIDAVADEHLGGPRLLRQHPVVRVVIAVEYWPAEGKRIRTLKITLSEPNRCNLRGNANAALRKLGYDLLEHWGVLQPLRTLGPDDRRRLLSALLALYDLGATTWTEHELSERGFDVEAFAGHGFVEPAGRLRDLLIDEDDGSPEVVQVGAGIGETGEFEDFGGRPAWVPKTLVKTYRVNTDWVLETVLKELLPGRSVRSARRVIPALECLGELELGDEVVVCYLARGLLDARTVRRLEDHLRGSAGTGYGLILSAGEPGVGFLGSNVVLDVRTFMNAAIDQPALDFDQLRLAYLSSRQRARNGSVVELIASPFGTATLHIPGKAPISITGAKQIGIVDKLVEAHRRGTRLVPTGELLKDTSCATPKQAFSNWIELENTYIGSPKKGFWQLLA